LPSDLPTSPLIVTGWKRWLFFVLGCGCVVLGYLGAIIPGLPMTPFLLMASYFFVRSSPRLHGWLRRSPWVGRVLRDWEEHRGVRRSVKITACLMVVAVVTLTVAFSGAPSWAKIVVVAFAALGMTVVACLPTVVRNSPNPPSPRQVTHQA
jgi:uncharacterized membrane protein YbaN (DUF454 family)